MAVKTYLQTAITQVQSAMADMETQIHSMYSSLDSKRHQTQQECTNLERERALHQVELGHMSDSLQKRALEARIAKINQQLASYKAEVSKMEAVIAANKQRKDQLHRDLYNATGELTRLMSLPDIG